MNWYLVKIVFRVICGDGNHAPQFDEQLRLIAAEDETKAFIKATEIGQKETETFVTESKKLVEWRFINVSEMYKISEYIDGAELYSATRETEDAEMYLELVHKKAATIRQVSTQKYLQLL